jgi:hypothetical protein
MYGHIEQYGWQLYNQAHDLLLIGGLILAFAAIDAVGAILHVGARHAAR